MKSVLFSVSAGLFFCICGLSLMVHEACAHRVNVFAWVEGDTVHVQSKFSGGNKVKSGRITVMDPKGVALLSGLTNDQGEFAFKIPLHEDLRIVLTAGEGHQGEWTLRAKELTGGSSTAVTESEPVEAEAVRSIGPSSGSPGQHEHQEPDTRVRPDELEAVIEAVLDRKLKPITGMLADLRQEGPSVRDIFAGIGYILGLVGIAAYFHNRKQKD